VSPLAFTTSFFTLEWTHAPNRQQPDDAPDTLQRSLIKLVIPLSTVEYTRDTLVYSTVDSGITITYSYSASFIWNSLPSDVLYCNSEPTFKKHLKTFLFNSCFYAAWLTPPSAPL